MALAQPEAETTDTRSAEALEAGALAMNFSAPVAKALGAIAAEAGWDAADLDGHLNPKLSNMMAPAHLPDIDKACGRIAQAVREGEVIGLVCDHDADGTSAAVIFIKALTECLGHPADRIRLVVSHRLKEGYGLCAPVAERIMALDVAPSLILTADCGSGDSERIQLLKRETGADTIVTDHHGSGDAVPGAYAFVNPKRPDASPGADPTIAGCMVAWCVMAHTWRVMSDAAGEEISPKSAMVELLDYAALGTLADCVDISGRTNRAVLRYGMSRVNAGARPCWRIARNWARRGPGEVIWSADIAYQVAPRIAASGRMDASRPGVRFLYSPDMEEASRWGAILDKDNQERKKIQGEMLDDFLAMMDSPDKLQSPVVVVGSQEGHAGIQGICAARLADLYDRPAFVLTLPPGTRGWRGSARAGTEAVNLRAMFAHVEENHPELLLTWGGHHAAAGFTLTGTDEATLFAFTEAMGVAARALGYDGLAGAGRIEGDAAIEIPDIGPELLSELNAIEPFGKGFRQPCFTVNASLLSTKPFNSDAIGQMIFLGDRENPEARRLKVALFGKTLLDQIQPAHSKAPWQWVVEIGAFNGGPSLVLRDAYPVEE